MIQTSSRDVSFVLKYAEDYLKESGIISARNEAEVLLMYLLGVKRFRFYDFQGLEDTIFTKYKNLLNERARRVPLQYITGISSFMGIEFITERGVFIPRPETEVLVERVIELFKDKETVYGLDIGTGTANIAISLTKFLSNCRILAIENSKRALGIARINAEKNNLTEKINFREIDIL
ncbi:MAG: methyltransferase domain-containing protein, partial [Candidatus Omnitrophica bacterium]|nr:methyltransferase domain-containing protein [Candidatus Omnitrophota bacterium]